MGRYSAPSPISRARMRRESYWSMLQEKAQVCVPLYPEMVYDADFLAVLKAIIVLTTRRGIAPDIKQIQRYKQCNMDGLKRYIEDLYVHKYIKPVAGDGWTGTEEGFKVLGYEYQEPFLPTNVRLRTRAIAEANKLARLINDPVVSAQFERKYGVNLSKLWDNANDIVEEIESEIGT